MMNEEQANEKSTRELNFVQIQAVPVPNTSYTQCNVFLYGLDRNGKVWFKREMDLVWQRETMKGEAK